MLTKMHGLAGWLIVAGFALVTTNPLLAQERGERGGPAGQHVSGQLKSIDAAAHTITITTTTPGGGGRDGGERREPVTTEKTFSLAKNVEVAVGTGTFFSSPWGRVGAHVPLFKEAKLTELAAGIQVSLALSADQKTAVSILAAGPVVKGVLKAVDATKNTITIQLPGGPADAAAKRPLPAKRRRTPSPLMPRSPWMMAEAPPIPSRKPSWPTCRRELWSPCTCTST